MSDQGYHLPPLDAITDLTAPKPWSRPIHTLVQLVLGTAFIASIPAIFCWTTFRYFTIGPPHPAWDYRTHLTRNMLYFGIFTSVGLNIPIVDGRENKVPARWIRKGLQVTQLSIPPCDQSLLTGWAKHSQVKPVTRPGFMISPKQTNPTRGQYLEKAKKVEKIVLYLVGGGYITGHPLLTHLSWSVSRWLDARVFCPNYRKSLSPDSAFPGNLLDAFSGWIYLTQELGFDPKNIVLMGDSAGGGTALALARYLGELGNSKPELDPGHPGGMILFSPWCDMTSTIGTSGQTNHSFDYVSSMANHAVPSHTRHYPKHINSPYFSPALPAPNGETRFQHLVRAGTKVYIQVGGGEVLLDQGKALADGMKGEGVDVRLREVPGDIHVGVLFKLAKPLQATEKDLPEFWNSLV